jgi:hypothetical protein
MGSYHKIDCGVVVRHSRLSEEVVGSNPRLAHIFCTRFLTGLSGVGRARLSGVGQAHLSGRVGPACQVGGGGPLCQVGRWVGPDCQVGRVGRTRVWWGQWGLNVNQLDTKSEYMTCGSHMCSHI